VIQIIVLQLFWMSFALIGTTVLFWCAQRVRTVKHSQFIQFLQQTHPLSALVVAFAVGVSMFVPFIVPAYICELSIWVVEVPYLIAVVSAVGIAFQARRIWLAWLSKKLRFDRNTMLIASVLSIILAVDYVICLHVQGLLTWDAPVHVARINYILGHQRFALADPYLGNHGVVDPRYTTNLLLGLQSIAANLLHLSATKVWYYSYAFFRLVVWLSLFTLAWNFIDKKNRNKWSYIILGVSPFVYNLYFRFAEVPDRIVLVWVILFIIGLKLWLQKGSWVLLMLASLLIATTHTINSLMGIGFLGLLGLMLLVTKSLTKAQAVVLVASGLVLALPLSFNLYYPNRTAESERAFTANAISGSNPEIVHYGPFLLSRLPFVSLMVLGVFAILAGCIYLVDKTKSAPKRVSIYLLALCTGLLLYDPRYISLLGYVYLYKKTTNSKVRLLLVLLIVYYGLLVYNPLFLHFAQHRIPPWVISRFQEFNVLMLIAAVLGWLLVIEAPTFMWGYKRLTAFLYMAAPLVYLFVLPHVYIAPAPTTALAFQDSDNRLRHHIYDSLEGLQPYLKGQVIYTDDLNYTFLIPSIVRRGNTINNLDTNYSPMASIVLRKKCYESLLKNLDPADLQAAGVTRVLIDTTTSKSFDNKASRLPYLDLLTEHNGIKVYRVDQSNVAASRTATSVCAIPYEQ
jgi:hypothetical protein